jgi:aspartate-semialdehyde dehydrogenase
MSAILGATGAVGTRFVQLLENHPFLELVAVGASTRSAGKRYDSVIHWQHPTPVPPKIAEMIVRSCEPSEYPDCEIIFSGLDSSVAGEVETAFLEADFAVFSNAGNHRMAPFVPLLVPTVNISHLQMIPAQREHYGRKKGFLVCNSNCAGMFICLYVATVGILLTLLRSCRPCSAISSTSETGRHRTSHRCLFTSDFRRRIPWHSW